MSDPIALARAAATPPQPVPLRADGGVREPQASGSLHVRGRSPTRDGAGSIISRGSSPASSVRGASPPPALGSSPPVAPYQALPVRGPVITHNLTAGLPVLDPGKEPSEVREGWEGQREHTIGAFSVPAPKSIPRAGAARSPSLPLPPGGW